MTVPIIIVLYLAAALSFLFGVAALIIYGLKNSLVALAKAFLFLLLAVFLAFIATNTLSILFEL